MKLVNNVIGDFMGKVDSPVVLAGDLNTDFMRSSLSKNWFEDLIFKQEGYRIFNKKYTFHRGDFETDIDHMAIFENTEQVVAIDNQVLGDPVSNHSPLLTTFQTNVRTKA